MAAEARARKIRLSHILHAVHRLKLVRLGEPKSIRRNLPSVQVNGNAQSCNWPGVFISHCQQWLTAFQPPAPALSIPQAGLWGPKPTVTVPPVARKSGRELSDSLLNRLKRVNSRVACGTSSDFELAAQDAITRRGTWSGAWTYWTDFYIEANSFALAAANSSSVSAPME